MILASRTVKHFETDLLSHSRRTQLKPVAMTSHYTGSYAKIFLFTVLPKHLTQHWKLQRMLLTYNQEQLF
jgi:hypothetical protein